MPSGHAGDTGDVPTIASLGESPDLRTPSTPQEDEVLAPRPWWRSRHVLPVAAIVAVVLVANAPYLTGLFDPNPLNLYAGLSDLTRTGVLPGLPSADPNTGITAQALGHLAALDWVHGHVPWWNPYEGLGAPLAGEMQSAAFFPPTLLLLFANGQVAFHLVLELVAGLATFALLVRLRLATAVAASGAIAYALAGAFSWFGHAPVNPLPFLPVLLLGAELATDAAAAARRWGWVVLATGVAFSVVAGFPETAYIGGVLAALWAIARLWELPSSRRRAFAWTVVGGAGTGLLLAAPILVAFLDYIHVGDVGGHSGQFGQVSLPGPAISQVLIPYIYGPIDAFSNVDSTGLLQSIWDNVGGYLTVSLVPLAIIGVAGAIVHPRSAVTAGVGPERHRVLRLALVAWLVLALGRTFGIAPLHGLVNVVPGMQSVAFYRYSDASWTMALVVLAAFGFDDLLRARATRRTVGVTLGLTVLAVLGSFLEARGLSAHLATAAHHRAWEWGSVLWALAVVAGVGVVALFGRGSVRRLTIAAIVVVDAVAMFVVPQLSAPRHAVVYPAPVTYLAAHLGDARFVTAGPLPANYGSYFGLASLNSNDVPQPSAYDRAVQRRLQLSSTPTATMTQIDTFLRHLSQYEALGVRYLVTPGDVTLPHAGARVLHRVLAGPSGEIFEVPHPQTLFATPSGGCRVVTQTLDQALVRCARAGTLVRRELDMPGWTAEVNGHAAPVRTHGVVQAVHVPAGESTVRFGFSPPFLTEALVAFVIGLLILVAMVVVPRRRGLRLPGEAPGRASAGPEIA